MVSKISFITSVLCVASELSGRYRDMTEQLPLFLNYTIIRHHYSCQGGGVREYRGGGVGGEWSFNPLRKGK